MREDLKEKLVLFGGMFHDIGKFLSGSMISDSTRRNKYYRMAKELADDIYTTKPPYFTHHELMSMLIVDKMFTSNVFLNISKTHAILTLHHHSHGGMSIRYGDPDISTIRTYIKTADIIASSSERDEMYSGHTTEDVRSMVNPFTTLDKMVSVNELTDDNLIKAMTMAEFVNLDNLENSIGFDVDSIDRIYDKITSSTNSKIDFNSDIFSFGEYLNSFLRFYTSFLPDARPYGSNIRIPDSSLYSHLKLVAAIAHILYKTGDKEGINGAMLVAGDISGIQNFISDVPIEKAAKILKLKSIIVRMLELFLSRYVAKEFGVTPINIFLSSGGKFYVLVPNDKKKFEQIRKKIKDRLWDYFHGSIFVSLSSTSFTWEEFTANEKNGKPLIYSVEEDLWIEKLKKYDSIVNKINSWESKYSDGKRCTICYSEATGEYFDTLYCKNHEEIVRSVSNLKKINGIVFDYSWVDNASNSFFRIVDNNSTDNRVIRIDVGDKNVFNGAFEFLPISYPLDDNGDILQMSDLADEFGNSKKIFFFKGDIDNLGYYMGKVGGRARGERVSISRMLTFSGMLDSIFSGWLPRKIDKLNAYGGKVYLLFAGGDDFTFFGSFDALKIYLDLIRGFEKLTKNRLTISASLSFFDPHKRFIDMYKESKERLEKAKQFAGVLHNKNKGFKCGLAVNSDDYSDMMLNKAEYVELLEKPTEIFSKLVDVSKSKTNSTVRFIRRVVRKIMKSSTNKTLEVYDLYLLEYMLRDVPDLKDKIVDEIGNIWRKTVANRDMSLDAVSKLNAIRIGIDIAVRRRHEVV